MIVACGSSPSSGTEAGSADGGTSSGTSGEGTHDAGEGDEHDSDGDEGGQTCEGPGNCVLYPLGCDEIQCGGISMFDDDGCVRARCTSAADECPADERCYRPEDFGGCLSSAGCYDDMESMSCVCGSDPDCGGAYCLPTSLWPEPEAGPGGSGHVQDACAPDDGPAHVLSLGLTEDDCEATLPGDTPTVTIRLDGIDPVPGTHAIGNAFSQGTYRPGDGTEQNAKAGQVVIETWTETAVTGAYDLILQDGTFLGGDFDVPYCPIDTLCG